MFDMSYMGAYYPIVIGLIGLIYVVVIYHIGQKKKMYKTVLVMIAFGIFMVVFGPIKIDGTNTAKNNQATSKQRAAEYVKVIETRQVIRTTKPTFAERMAAEEARSQKANQKIKDQILMK